MKFINKILLAAMLIPAALLSSCLGSNEDDPTKKPVQISAFATLTGKSETGMSFTTSEYLGSSTITYTTPLYSQFKGEIGQRYVIYFTREDNNSTPFVSGPVSLFQINEPFTGTLQYAPLSEISQKLPNNAYCLYRHAALDYLDISFYAPIYKQPKTFCAYVDEATADNDYPDVYICYESDDALLSQQTFFGTFNMQSLLEKTTNRGFNLHFRYSNGLKYVQKFHKDGSAPDEPVTEL